MHALGRTLALMLLIFITILVPESSCSVKGREEIPPDDSFPFSDDNIFPDGVGVTMEIEIITPVSVQIGIKAQLFCHPSPSKEATLRIWEITPRDWPSCRLPYRAELQQISKKICTERGTTRVPAHHQSSDLPIKSMALKHDGHYSCRIETTDGIFQERHSIQVPGENRTVVCEAIASKPAMQILWTPDEDCVTKSKSHNDTMIVRSKCHREKNNGHSVFCFISHLTDNWILSMEQNRGTTSILPSLLSILYVKLAVTVLIVGFAFFQKRNYFSSRDLVFMKERRSKRSVWQREALG
uniref:Cell surface glycoprotein CD200 receptor 3 n=1 Tax=Mus musculus TaxID=10090 RepID=MO2R3_MOUSE|nr:RecName: Full=Cell surface glycoprotein CD200 receptor 3; AltName: Full=CD200 cell surface glycoprotein receptor-like 3; Short=CD200 receptor-like 3; AltName: Full=CD200 cell surface glycoprotein receptor-like b; Short=CD200RLb; AltName: Full=Cell surface glycoprotein OX2 receptor 3; Flags: Precursor [Mus musculus]AAV40660.1 CD200R3 isoform B [Mus musculus]